MCHLQNSSQHIQDGYLIPKGLKIILIKQMADVKENIFKNSEQKMNKSFRQKEI